MIDPAYDTCSVCAHPRREHSLPECQCIGCDCDGFCESESTDKGGNEHARASVIDAPAVQSPAGSEQNETSTCDREPGRGKSPADVLKGIARELDLLYERRRPLTRTIRQQGSFGASPAQAEELAEINGEIDALEAGAELFARRAQAARTAERCELAIAAFSSHYRFVVWRNSPLRARTMAKDDAVNVSQRIRRGARLLIFWAIRRST